MWVVQVLTVELLSFKASDVKRSLILYPYYWNITSCRLVNSYRRLEEL
jgi:hypothetical protein